MRISGSPATADILSSLRWSRAFGNADDGDGRLVVASETVNPTAREDLLFHAPEVRETAHFTVLLLPNATLVLHRFRPDEIDNDLAEYVAGELVRSGYVELTDAFERCFAGVVTSSFEDKDTAWDNFYRNTLAGLGRVMAGRYEEDDFSPVAVFGRLYARAAELVVGSSVLDVGTCFGFFPLTLKETSPHLEVTALDVSAPILGLARAAASRSSRTDSIRFVEADGRELPFGDGSYDTVTSLHVLEHLLSADVRLVLEEMCRVAERRVVVAVPMEKEADTAFDHERSFDRDSLQELGESIVGWRCRFEEFMGGWILLEREGERDP